MSFRRRVDTAGRTTAMVAMVAVLITTAGCGSDTKAAAPGPPTTKKAEYKVTVAGDSISVGLGSELRKAVGSGVNVVVIGEEGTGLARPEKFDWPARLQKLAREFPPTILVFSVGSNDSQDLLDASGNVVAPSANKAAWDTEYSRRLAEGFDAFEATTTKIIWVGQVHTADTKVGATNRRVHRLAEGSASSRPWVTVADLGSMLRSGERIATTCLMPDGVHLTVDCLADATRQLAGQLPGPPPN